MDDNKKVVGGFLEAVSEAIWIFTLAGGKITEIRAVSDRLGLSLQLGWPWPQADRPYCRRRGGRPGGRPSCVG
ncbi:hypothetical protein [Streptomyces sp. NPDC051636]|uniref:hypothetical protein n=1 Tax=Streptomyces sp. NPDC051636 TaxID=3365663 RepID=UPI0037944990